MEGEGREESGYSEVDRVETGLMGQLQRDLERGEENIDECVLV